MRILFRSFAAVAISSLASCALGPAAHCEAGNAEPRCPVSSESPFSTRYEAVCGEAYVDCTTTLQVIAPDGRPTCDPAAPEEGPTCAGGWTPYCYFADCRSESTP
ncbi:MAG: hypothetical protein KC619_03770 [Myxococcales bacterium]|nr:hypothetical protein [Myxococcales bacterium]